MEIVDTKLKYPLWLRIFLPLLLISPWLGIGGVGGPTFGKISSVSTNDQASFLPARLASYALLASPKTNAHWYAS